VEISEYPENKNIQTDAGWRKKTAVFMTSQGISLFGSSMVNYAIIWYITLKTQSGMIMTITILTSFLPQIVISLFAGVWADRYNRKTVIILSDALTAISTLILAELFLLGHREIWFIFIASAVRSVGEGIQSPAVSAILPQFVPQEKLMRVNGLSGSMRSFIMLLSPAAGGWLLAAYSVEVACFVDVVTAAIAISILLFLRVPPHRKAGMVQTTGTLQDLRQGFSYVRSSAILRRLLIYYAAFFFLISPTAFLTPLLITRSFGGEVWKLTANEVLYSGGAVFGGFLMAIWGGFRNRMRTIALAFAAYGVSAVLLGISTNLFFYLTVMFFTGIFSPVCYSAEAVLIQENVDNDMQGRVFSMIDMIILAVMPLGMLLFGPIADLTKVQYILIAAGIFMFLLGCTILVSKEPNESLKN